MPYIGKIDGYLASTSKLGQAPAMDQRRFDAAAPSPPATPASRGGRRQLGTDTATSLPVYHQLHLVLSQRIRDGVHAPGSRFPSEFALAAKYDVSRVSVRRALAQLEADGLIARRRGAGTFVTERKREGDRPTTGEIDNLITIGMETDTRLLYHGPARNPPPQACAALGLEPGQALVEIERLRLHQGQPFSLTSLYLRPAEAALLDIAALGSAPVVSALDRAGLPAAKAEQTISATLADDEVAGRLDVSLGSAVVRVRRVVLDATDRGVLFQQSLYRSDRYEYHMLLTRESSAEHPSWRHI
jgi:GntR family transcriptional regulator